jgi:hypothetical protein
MAKSRDLVFDNYYAPYASGQGFRNNPTNNRQTMAERMYMRHLTELCVNRFEWKGLPKSIDARFLEMTLYRNGLSVFYWDNDFGRYLTLRASGQGMTNHYDNPVSFRVTGNTMINKTLSGNDCVPIWSNYMRMPDLDIVLLYSKRLADLDRTIEINSKNLRKSKLVIADENQRLSWQNINRQLEEGVEVIYGTSALDSTQAQVFDFGADPVGVVNLQIVKSKMWNECMTMLGINNANQDKKERLVANEVDANDEQVFATRAISLNARRAACEQINRKYTYPDGTPLNISVDFVNLDELGTPNVATGMEIE